MGFSIPFVVIPFVLSSIIALMLALVAWRRNRNPGSLTFALMMLAVAIWLVMAIFEKSSVSEPGKLLWAKASYLGIAWVGTLWLSFVLEYVYPGNKVTQRISAWLGVFPIISIALVMTNDQNGLIWEQITPHFRNGRLSLDFQQGIWFWVFLIYSYLVLLIGALIMIRAMIRFPQFRRRQVICLIVGMVLPWFGNIAYLAGFLKPLNLDLTPYGFSMTGIIYAWTLFRLGLFDLAPLAHEAILENLGDAFLVLDRHDRVIEANRLVCHFLGLDEAKVYGQNAKQALAHWPALLDLLDSSSLTAVEFNASRTDIQSGEEGPDMAAQDASELYLEAALSSWYLREDKPAGRILILRDITRRRKAEESLRASEQLYRLLVNASPIGIAMTDSQGKLTFVSPVVLNLFHVMDDHLAIGNSVLNWIDPEDYPLVQARLQMVLENKVEEVNPHQYRLIRPDGTRFWGEITVVPILNDGGPAKGLMATIHEVTERKMLEFTLHKNLSQQTFINKLLHILYRPHNLTEALQQVLEQAGLYLEASRVYLCQDSPDGLETSIELEWCREGIPSRAREGVLVRYARIPTWRSLLEEHEMVLVADQQSTEEDIAEYMSTWNTLSVAAFPIYGNEERLNGFLGVDYCKDARGWSDEDIDMLWNLCRVVSGAVAQRETELAERRQRALAEALHDTSSALTGTLNFEEVLDRILTNLEKVVKSDAASIALVDSEGCVSFVRWRGYDSIGEKMMRSFRVPIGERETYRWMALTGEPVFIADTWVDKRWISVPEYNWIRSYAGLPIQIKGRVIGFINLDCATPDFFTTDLAYSLHVFADQAAVAIDNARLFDQARQRAEEMSILYRIGLTLTAGLEMEQVLVSLFEQCCQVLPIDVFYVAVYDSETGIIDLPLYYNELSFLKLAPRSIIGQPSTTGEVIRRKRTIYLPDTLEPDVEREFNILRLGGNPSRSYVGVPLILLDQVVGVISMQSLLPYAYSSDQIRLLETIATQAAIAVQNARIYDKMKQMAITDTVTMLYTRRHFMTLGRSEVERALRYDRSLSVLMVDIDHFKRINDSFGHSVGDIVLQVVAKTCGQALRATDIIGRWGGEEFVIVLPEADQIGAAMIAERIRRIVGESVIEYSQECIHVTVSVGVATLRVECCSLEVLVDAADRAMYQAKENGRNQVKIADFQQID